MSRIPISTDLKTRTGAPDKDARLKNCYVETKGEQSVVRKRPIAQGGVTTGPGIAQGGCGLVIINGDELYPIPIGTTCSGATTYQIGDMVTVDFVNYWAVTDHVGNCPVGGDPGADWSTSVVPAVPDVYATTSTYLTFNASNVINWTDVHGGYLNESGNAIAQLSTSHSSSTFAGMVSLVIADMATTTPNVTGAYYGSVWDAGIGGLVDVAGTYSSPLTMIGATAVDASPATTFFIDSVASDITSASCTRSDLMPNGTVIGSLGGLALYAWWRGVFSEHP